MNFESGIHGYYEIDPERVGSIDLKDFSIGEGFESSGGSSSLPGGFEWTARIDDQRQLIPTCEYEIWPKFWYGAIGARQHLRLIMNAVRVDSEIHPDIAEFMIDESDDVRISFSFTLKPISSEGLKGALERMEAVCSRVSAASDVVVASIERDLARSSELLRATLQDNFSELVGRVEDSRSVNSHEKGQALENLMSKFFDSIAGFSVESSNLRTETEELDLVVLNGSDDPMFSREGSSIIVECKNWGKPSPRMELSALEGKVRNRGNRCTIAFLVSWAGHTQDAKSEVLRMSHDSYRIVLLDGEQVSKAALAGPEAIWSLVRKSTFDAIHS